MAAGGHFEKKIKTKKLYIDLKWREMRTKVIFGHKKWPKTDFQKGGQRPFCKKQIHKKKLCIDLKWREKKSSITLKWREVRSEFIFGHPKWGGGGITMASL